MKRFKEKINGSDPNWAVIGIGTIGTSEFFCRKCTKIVDDPVRMACCDSLLCRICSISETNTFVCRYCYCIFSSDKPVEYKEVSRFFLQILNSTIIHCSTDQCKEKFPYFRRETHLEYKCNGHKRCDQCGEEYIVKNKHICVRTVRSVIEEIENDATIPGDLKEKRFYEYMMKMSGYPKAKSPEIAMVNEKMDHECASLFEIPATSFYTETEVAETLDEGIESSLLTDRLFDVPGSTDLDFSDYDSEEFYENGYKQQILNSLPIS